MRTTIKLKRPITDIELDVDENSIVPHWIPVTDRLPEDGIWAIFTDGKNISAERYKSDLIDHFFPSGRFFDLEDAVAWMPLPEPYTEEPHD